MITPDESIPTSTEQYGPDLFASDIPQQQLGTQTNEPLPFGAPGGIIESVKRAVVIALRKSLVGSATEQELYVDLEYPLKPTQYPGVWVQFSIVDLRRMGLAHEAVQLNTVTGDWDVIQEWQFTGRITLTIAALTSIDRDRLADQVIAQLAFSRPPDPVLVKPGRDNQQYRALVTALDQNPYVSLTVNTDVLTTGGQSVSQGVPWQQDILLYEDAYAFDCFGQFNVRFSDGVYTLSRVQPAPQVVEQITDGNTVNWWPEGDPSPGDTNLQT